MAALQMLHGQGRFAQLKISTGKISHGHGVSGFPMSEQRATAAVPSHHQHTWTATATSHVNDEMGRSNAELFALDFLRMGKCEMTDTLELLQTCLSQQGQFSFPGPVPQMTPQPLVVYANPSAMQHPMREDIAKPLYVEVAEMGQTSPSNFFNSHENFSVMQVDRPRHDSISSTNSEQPSPRSLDDGYMSGASSIHSSEGEDLPRHFTEGKIGKRKNKTTEKKVFRQRDKNSAKLWEWLLYLLNRPSSFGHVVRWDNTTEGTFKFGDTEQLTELYNQYKMSVPGKAPKKRIQYESITRALRHCYNTSIINQIPKKKKYRFGKNAERWEQGVTRDRALESLENWQAGSTN